LNSRLYKQCLILSLLASHCFASASLLHPGKNTVDSLTTSSTQPEKSLLPLPASLKAVLGENAEKKFGEFLSSLPKISAATTPDPAQLEIIQEKIEELAKDSSSPAEVYTEVLLFIGDKNEALTSLLKLRAKDTSQIISDFVEMAAEKSSLKLSEIEKGALGSEYRRRIDEYAKLLGISPSEMNPKLFSEVEDFALKLEKWSRSGSQYRRGNEGQSLARDLQWSSSQLTEKLNSLKQHSKGGFSYSSIQKAYDRSKVDKKFLGGLAAAARALEKGNSLLPESAKDAHVVMERFPVTDQGKAFFDRRFNKWLTQYDLPYGPRTPVIISENAHDHNGAMMNAWWDAYMHGSPVYVVNSLEELKRVGESLRAQKALGQIDQVIISGHGSPYGMTVGKNRGEVLNHHNVAAVAQSFVGLPVHFKSCTIATFSGLETWVKVTGEPVVGSTNVVYSGSDARSAEVGSEWVRFSLSSDGPRSVWDAPKIDFDALAIARPLLGGRPPPTDLKPVSGPLVSDDIDYDVGGSFNPGSYFGPGIGGSQAPPAAAAGSNGGEESSSGGEGSGSLLSLPVLSPIPLKALQASTESQDILMDILRDTVRKKKSKKPKSKPLKSLIESPY
jgi:hypothetical protein